MITTCPICGSRGYEPVFAMAHAQIFQLIRVGEVPGPECFAPLEIVRCESCAHLYDRLYSEEVSARMYRGEILSNVPVHVSMSKNLERITDWIGPGRYVGKRVVEVGGGSGHLARILAQRAAWVQVFEPSVGLRSDMLPESNVTLVHEPFCAALVERPVDLMVCRQVLEHVADPLALLSDMRQALSSDGALYLEVPRAEYIETHATLFDFHYAHVQFFHEPNLQALAARAGFVVERQWHLKDGHDVGILLRPGRSSVQPMAGLSLSGRDLPERLRHRELRCRAFLHDLESDVGLYGATWPALTFLSLFESDREFVVVFDENLDYTGYALYSRTQCVPVATLSRHTFKTLRAVLLTAYLHEQAIVGTLQRLGFCGTVVRIEPECVEVPLAPRLPVSTG